MEHWGAPEGTVQEEHWLFKITVCFRLLKKPFNALCKLLAKERPRNIPLISSWFIRSKIFRLIGSKETGG